MLQPFKASATVLLLALLPQLLAGCAHGSPLSRPQAGPQIPPLPVVARQPVKPPECSPTCSAGASTEFDAWLTTPTKPAPPAKPASGPTTH